MYKKQTKLLLHYGLVTMAFWLLCSFSAIAGTEKAVIGFNKAPIQKVLETIGDVYKVAFTYDPQELKGSQTINLDRKERSLTEVLKQVGDIAGLRFMQAGRVIGVQKIGGQLSSPAPRTHREEVLISGRVVDAAGQPMSGVSVAVKGSSRGTTTNANGEFSITVQKGEVLVFSSVDFASQEIVAEKTTTVTITLQPNEKALQEVVVTALGVKKEKAKVAYAIQDVKGELLQKAPETNVANNLVGKVAGLSIYTKSTLYENPEIYIRGQSTLVVIDGVPTQTDFWNINPNDIESVNVLKGTAAAALYGSLGINGAIMITTKRGKPVAMVWRFLIIPQHSFKPVFCGFQKPRKNMVWAGTDIMPLLMGKVVAAGTMTMAMYGDLNSTSQTPALPVALWKYRSTIARMIPISCLNFSKTGTQTIVITNPFHGSHADRII